MDYARVRSWVFPDVEATYTDRDTMLYALGIGLGSDPTDPRELRFVSEPRLRALPTMVAVVARNRPWLGDVGCRGDRRRARGAADRLGAAAPGRRHGRRQEPPGRDRRQGRRGGARSSSWSSSSSTRPPGDRLSVAVQTNFIRGAGGFGGPPVPRPGAASAARPAARRRGRLPDPAPGGPDLSPVGRPQSPPRRSGGGAPGRVPAPHPPRLLHLRHRGLAGAPGLRGRRPGAAGGPRRPVLGVHAPRRDPPHRDVA